MKQFLVLAFIFFSMLTTFLELGSFEVPCNEVSFSSQASLSSDHHECPHQQKKCHDSNCYGSAHFGHGFYDQSKAFTFASILTIVIFETDFPKTSHHSLVFLDTPLRPPLLIS